ncbi:uncharacterized protein AMSG_08330 [Thecamonas trahens ATCC 50062]|uniref:Uncharacterized protein n=1 Tax=Thecamonas trahens ATCC 50062 TaxID=461836 RepID=A0A0L0DJ75_THETB|nr:hypothetical protein AMSG_08330 [Thecamonas trahens ATCC 50062]KNC52357.1 hypothetical protein AMSG_08330 [Thecamonas trahens ATCC 50062]|eukprot:XP_013755406.1 hypothetical protein AMSG_08330 [Thecamonas trahens ATCC 50062]
MRGGGASIVSAALVLAAFLVLPQLLCQPTTPPSVRLFVSAVATATALPLIWRPSPSPGAVSRLIATTSGALLPIFVSPFVMLVLITLGAPSSNDTLALALVLAVLVAGSGARDERLIAGMAWGAVVGAWLSAAALPLDWDRPWQAWPIPPAVGSVCGFVVGSALALVWN